MRLHPSRRVGAGALAAALAVSALAFASPSAATATAPAVVTYAEDEAVIANPARGFYHHTETHSYSDGSGWTALQPSTLAGWRAEGISQILRVVYLERYVDADLDATVLDAVAADFETARQAGTSVILRFAYAQGGAWPYSPPYNDASPERVLSHIEQLTPLLRANSDVIAVMQSGFVGLWGEGYYTDHFVADPAVPEVVTDADWAARSSVVDALLAALPDTRMVQVRTMYSKQRAFDRPSGEAGALTPAQAFDATPIARVGHHNDCFLASPDDYGTFLSNPITLDEDYLAAETRFVPMGGETCAVNPPRSEWESASALLARYHFSYLNTDYNRDVLNSWGSANLTEVAKRLGYRFVLERSSVVDGDEPSIEFDVRNEGWAAPYNPRPVELVLRGTSGNVTVPVDVDARTWAPGETTTVRVPLDDVPAGDYDAFLSLPAAEPSVADDARFAIRTANVDTWDAELGLNDFHQRVTVGSVPSAVPAPRVDVTASGVLVSWTPAPVAHAAVTGYTVTLTARNGATRVVEADGAATSVAITDVHPGRWRAGVVAHNALGDSAPSPQSRDVNVNRGQVGRG